VMLAPESPLHIPSRAFVVVVTHGTFDEEALERALQSDARYVSLVTSRKRAGVIIDALRDRGVPEDRLRRLKAPAGLDIGAVTPDEIAISILAEIVQVSRNQVVQSGPSTDTLAMDPVCGMAVEIASAKYRSNVSDRDFYFCGPGCKREFDRDPARFAGTAAE
jgi:xanthine dehydrogenase accessory factor